MFVCIYGDVIFFYICYWKNVEIVEVYDSEEHDERGDIIRLIIRDE